MPIRICCFEKKNGAPGKIRTPDPLIRSQVLYPAELPVRRQGFTGWPVRLQGAITIYPSKRSR